MATWTLRTEHNDDLDEFIEDASLDPDFRHAYEDAKVRSALLRHLISVRKLQGLSQADVSCFMGTTQSAVSELEGGATDPQLSTLQRYARAMNARLRVRVTLGACAEPMTHLAAQWRRVDTTRSAEIAAILLSRKQIADPKVTFEDCFA